MRILIEYEILTANDKWDSRQIIVETFSRCGEVCCKLDELEGYRLVTVRNIKE